ncbi:unnamed protein product [Amoebophrya sp. A120]|nr:unnamed protein product [Amoebophrya sp. A120]|eukprot:GSA120T00008746001.1
MFRIFRGATRSSGENSSSLKPGTTALNRSADDETNANNLILVEDGLTKGAPAKMNDHDAAQRQTSTESTRSSIDTEDIEVLDPLEHKCPICLCDFGEEEKEELLCKTTSEDAKTGAAGGPSHQTTNPKHVFLPCCYVALHEECLLGVLRGQQIKIDLPGTNQDFDFNTAIQKAKHKSCKCPVCRQEFVLSALVQDAEFVKKLDLLATTKRELSRKDRDSIAINYANKVFLGVFLVGFGVREIIVVLLQSAKSILKSAFGAEIFVLKKVKLGGDFAMEFLVLGGQIVTEKAVFAWEEYIEPAAAMTADVGRKVFVTTIIRPAEFLWKQSAHSRHVLADVTRQALHYCGLAMVKTTATLQDFLLAPTKIVCKYVFFKASEVVLKSGYIIGKYVVFPVGKAVLHGLFFTFDVADKYLFQPVSTGTQFVFNDLLPKSLDFTYEIAKKIWRTNYEKIVKPVMNSARKAKELISVKFVHPTKEFLVIAKKNAGEKWEYYVIPVWGKTKENARAAVRTVKVNFLTPTAEKAKEAMAAIKEKVVVTVQLAEEKRLYFLKISQDGVKSAKEEARQVWRRITAASGGGAAADRSKSVKGDEEEEEQHITLVEKPVKQE